MIRAAYLRIYLPAERSGAYRRHDEARNLVRADESFVWEEATTDDAFTLDWGGRSFVCPRRPRLRMLEGILAFHNAYPGSGLISANALSHATAQLERLRVSAPGARSHILTSPWHVPLRWFAAFDPEEREVYRGDGGLSVRYRTWVGDAVERLRSAVEAIEGAGFDDSVVEQVDELRRWMQDFSYDGMAELDYDTVARLFNDGQLAVDESAADVHRSLRALERGDLVEAGEAYAEVAGRWAEAQSLMYVN